MSFYGESQWPQGAGAGYDVGAGAAGAQSSWDHQTPPTRSGASSTNPREEPAAFFYQFQEVEKAFSEMIKSGKIQPGMGMPPGRREFQPHFPPGPARIHPDFEPRLPGGQGRPHSPGFAGRGGPGHPSSNLQNFYASQRHQPSRGSNDAEQMQQHKRRLAAQRERELRNYHQEQQFNRTTAFPPGPQDVSAVPGPINPNPTRPDRTFSPGGTAEVPHHELIARQQSALYGKGPFGDAAGYIDENGAPRQGLPVHHGGPPNLRGPSPLTYDYGRAAPGHQEAGSQVTDPASIGIHPRERTSSNASPQSNPSGSKGPLEQANRTSNSSPGSGSPQNGRAPGGKTVAPIGTRPSVSQGFVNPKQSTTPLGYSASEGPGTSTAAPSSASATAPADGSSSLSGVGNWGQRSGGPWGSSKTQTSVWG